MILIALGANLPGPDGAAPIDTCRAAVGHVCDIPGLSLVALSAWYRTAPVPRGDQPDYCNGVLRFEGDVDGEALLTMLHQVEGRFGRVRGAPNAARTLDLDLIDLNGDIRDGTTLTLPHPRAHERAFVLRPIQDVAPGWRHPLLRQTVETLLAALPDQGVRVWE
jgi:2-amino-4-hydroxy-6-hydroxymethyldihydropteridine diphosphokinase